MITPGFERIDPTPGYPANYGPASYVGMKWDSDTNAAKAFRAHIKPALRERQQGRCGYCRRLLGETQDTDIEHIVEKNIDPNFSYVPHNLVISCSYCNGKKNSTFLRLKKTVAPALVAAPIIGAAYLLNPADYRWVHPHIDTYSLHIRIAKGWLYQPQTPKGTNTVAELALNEVGAIEARLRQERLLSRTGLMSKLVGAAAELNREKATVVLREVVKQMRDMRK